MGKLSYNGVTFPYEKIEPADQETVYSDDGMDYLYTRHTFLVHAHLDPSVPGLMLPGETFGGAVKRAIDRLHRPRGRLTLVFGDAVVLDVLGAPEEEMDEPPIYARDDGRIGLIRIHPVDPRTDVKNGPFPEIVSLTNLTGNHSCHLRFRVTCHVRDCPLGGPQWLSNRWEERVSLDGKKGITTRTRTGKLIIRPGPFGADAFRGVATPPIPEGFDRITEDIAIQSDGLALTYTFVDRDAAVLPPEGATDSSGEFRVAADRGVFRYAECSIHLTGDPKQTKERLVALATVVAIDRLEAAGLAKDKEGTWILLNAGIAEKMYENEVSVTVRALIEPPLRQVELRAGRQPGRGHPVIEKVPANKKPGDDPRGRMLLPGGADGGAFGFGTTPFGSERGISPELGLRGAAGLYLAAAALNAPCLRSAIEANQERLGLTTAVAPAADELRQPRGRARRKDGTELRGGPRAAGEARLASFGLKDDRFILNNDVVSVRVVDRLPDLTPVQRQASLDGFYTDYRIHMQYIRDEGVTPRTEMREDGHTHYLKTRAKSLRLRVKWTAERVGGKPVIPTTETGDKNVVVCGRTRWDPGTLDVREDGVTPVFRSSGVYTFGFIDPKKADLGGAVPPWVMTLMGKIPRAVILDGPPLIDDPAGKSELRTFPPADTLAGLRQWRDKQG